MATQRAVRTARETRQHIKRVAGRQAAVASVVLLPLTLLPFIGWWYPLELLSHFQLQYFLAALACAALFALLRRWRWFAVSLVSLLVAGSTVLPYLGPGRAAHADAVDARQRTVRVLLANVLLSNRSHGRVLRLVEEADADVLIFQEVNERWRSALTPITETYPYVAGKPREDAFGTLVYSRLPIVDVDVLMLGEAGRSTICLRVIVGGAPLSIVCTHPKPPLLPGPFTLRNDQLDQVADLIERLPRPLVLAGDLNTTMWSPWFRRLSERTAMRSVRRGFGVLASWPAALPGFMRIPIDHVLVTDDVSVTACRLGAPTGSDHLPLIVDLVLPPQ